MPEAEFQETGFHDTEVRQDPNIIADEVNAYTVTVLAGSWASNLFKKMERGTAAVGGATVDESYAMTYLMGAADMAGICSMVSTRGWTLEDAVAHIDGKVEEMCAGMGTEQEKHDDEEEEGGAE